MGISEQAFNLPFFELCFQPTAHSGSVSWLPASSPSARNKLPLFAWQSCSTGTLPEPGVSPPRPGFPHGWIGNQELQPLRQICCVASPEREAGIFHRFPIFWNITGEHTQSRTHSVKQCQGESFEIGWQNEEHRVGQQFIKSIA